MGARTVGVVPPSSGFLVDKASSDTLKVASAGGRHGFISSKTNQPLSSEATAPNLVY